MQSLKGHRFFRDDPLPASPIVDLPVFLFQKQEVPYDIEEALELKNVLSEIARAIARVMLWVP